MSESHITVIGHNDLKLNILAGILDHFFVPCLSSVFAYLLLYTDTGILFTAQDKPGVIDTRIVFNVQVKIAFVIQHGQQIHRTRCCFSYQGPCNGKFTEIKQDPLFLAKRGGFFPDFVTDGVIGTEEQQVEALKKWWAENGKSIIGGVVLGLAILFGWRGWTDYRQGEAELASEKFNLIQVAADRGVSSRVSELTTELQKDFSFTPYAGQASLMDAKLKAEAGDLEGAMTQLEWASTQAKEQVVSHNDQLDKLKAIYSKQLQCVDQLY